MALHSRHVMGKDDAVVYCPLCAKAVPKWAEKCQFCGAPIQAKKTHGGDVPTRRGGPKVRVSTSLWIVYYFAAACFILGGVYEASSVRYALSREALAGVPFLPIGLGVLTALFGFAVFFDVRVIRRAALTVAAVRGLLSMALVAGFLFGLVPLAGAPVLYLLLQGGYIVASMLLAFTATPISLISEPR